MNEDDSDNKKTKVVIAKSTKRFIDLSSDKKINED